MSKKLVLSSFIVFLICINFLPLNVFAGETKIFDTDYKQKIIDIIKNTEDKKDLDKNLSNYLSDVDVKLYLKDIESNKNMDKIEAKLEDTVYIDNDIKVDFYYPGYFTVSTNEIKSDDENNTRSFTGTKVANVTAYGILGNALWSAKVEGYFEYDRSRAPRPYLVNASYKRGRLSVWQVSNWRTGSAVLNNIKEANVYARGNFHFGLEYEGIGLVVEDKDLDLRLNCDMYGNTWGSHTLD